MPIHLIVSRGSCNRVSICNKILNANKIDFYHISKNNYSLHKKLWDTYRVNHPKYPLELENGTFKYTNDMWRSTTGLLTHLDAKVTTTDEFYSYASNLENGTDKFNNAHLVLSTHDASILDDGVFELIDRAYIFHQRNKNSVSVIHNKFFNAIHKDVDETERQIFGKLTESYYYIEVDLNKKPLTPQFKIDYEPNKLQKT